MDLREEDAVVSESDDCEGCFSPDGTDWTADVEEEEEEGQSMTRAVWMCGIEYYKGGDVRSLRKIKRRWIRSYSEIETGGFAIANASGRRKISNKEGCKVCCARRLSAVYNSIFVKAVMLGNKRFNVGCLQETLRGADVVDC